MPTTALAACLPSSNRSSASRRSWVARRLLVSALLALTAVLPARATLCSVDATPGATLLLPYFEVNLDNPQGLTTLFSINNASAVAVVTHVTLWSDLAVPVLGFNVYLTGFDVETFNLRDLLVGGHIPPSASASQDPNDTISPKGAFSQDLA